MASVLSLEHLGKQLPTQQHTWLFSDITVDIASPEITLIMGKSGQGKSTLLRLLGLLDTADDGTIRHLGKTPTEWGPEKWRMSVSYVAQQPVMLPGSVEDNLRAVSRLHKRPFETELARTWMESRRSRRDGLEQAGGAALRRRTAACRTGPFSSPASNGTLAGRGDSFSGHHQQAGYRRTSRRPASPRRHYPAVDHARLGASASGRPADLVFGGWPSARRLPGRSLL